MDSGNEVALTGDTQGKRRRPRRAIFTGELPEGFKLERKPPEWKKTYKAKNEKLDAENLPERLKKARARTKARLKASETAAMAANNSRRLKLQKYPWEEAREMFLSDSTLSLKNVAEQYDIPYSHVRTRASKERWTYQRAQEQAKLFASKRKEHLRRQAEESIRFDEQSINGARLGMNIVIARLAEIAQLHSAYSPTTKALIERLKNGEPVTLTELRASPINYKELDVLARALDVFQNIGRKAFGIDIQRIEVDIEGGELPVEEISVVGELGKDDPKRLGAFLEALERAGLTTLDLQDGTHTAHHSLKKRLHAKEDIVEAEVISDTAEIPAGGNSEPLAIEKSPEVKPETVVKTPVPAAPSPPVHTPNGHKNIPQA